MIIFEPGFCEKQFEKHLGLGKTYGEALAAVHLEISAVAFPKVMDQPQGSEEAKKFQGEYEHEIDWSYKEYLMQANKFLAKISKNGFANDKEKEMYQEIVDQAKKYIELAKGKGKNKLGAEELEKALSSLPYKDNDICTGVQEAQEILLHAKLAINGLYAGAYGEGLRNGIPESNVVVDAMRRSIVNSVLPKQITIPSDDVVSADVQKALQQINGTIKNIEPTHKEPTSTIKRNRKN